MKTRPDGFVDFADLPANLKAEARTITGRLAFLSSDDAPLFAFRVTQGWCGSGRATKNDPGPGRISPSRKDRRLSTAFEAVGGIA